MGWRTVKPGPAEDGSLLYWIVLGTERQFEAYRQPEDVGTNKKGCTRKPKPKPRATWVWVPATIAPKGAVHQEVAARACELIGTFFKAKHVRQAPESPGWNYVSDIVARWHRGFFPFVSIYTCTSPRALSPTFEAPFTRLRHVAGGTSDLAYMRHTGQWWELYHGLTLDEAFTAIREQMHFWPVT